MKYTMTSCKSYIFNCQKLGLGKIIAVFSSEEYCDCESQFLASVVELMVHVIEAFRSLLR